jgi:hypothetical protein
MSSTVCDAGPTPWTRQITHAAWPLPTDRSHLSAFVAHTRGPFYGRTTMSLSVRSPAPARIRAK